MLQLDEVVDGGQSQLPVLLVLLEEGRGSIVDHIHDLVPYAAKHVVMVAHVGQHPEDGQRQLVLLESQLHCLHDDHQVLVTGSFGQLGEELGERHDDLYLDLYMFICIN